MLPMLPYTAQGEEALVDFSLSQWHVGSADATTCLILAVVCPVTRKAWCVLLVVYMYVRGVIDTSPN